MVTIQLTRFTNLNLNGDDNDISYGYRIYNEDKCEYNNSFVNLHELSNSINMDTVIDFLQEYHPDFYQISFIDGEFEFNGNIITI